MKNIILILSLLSVGTTASALQFSEFFSYPPASALAGQNGWVLSSGTSPVIQSNTLTTPGLMPAGEGNSLAFGGGPMEVRHAMKNLLGGEQPGTYLYSLTFKVTSLGSLNTTGGFITGLSRSVQTASYGGLLYLRQAASPAGTYNIGVARTSGAGGDVTWDTTAYAVGQTNFVVCKYSTPDQGDTSTLLWINPDPSTYGVVDGSRPAPTLVATAGTDLLSGVGEMVIHQTSATQGPGGIILDQIRVEGGWPHVTPVPLTMEATVINQGNDLYLAWGGNQNIYLQGTSSLTPPATWTNLTSDAGARNYTVLNVNNQPTPKFYRLVAWYAE